MIFDRVKAFVLAHRSPSPSSGLRRKRQRLAMKNDFSARERKFISKLAEDLHLSVRWDEFAVLDENDMDGSEEVNVVTWRFPGDDEDEHVAKNGRVDGNGSKVNGNVVADIPVTVTVNGDDDGNDDEWVDEDEGDEEDEESRAAVDRVLGKYQKAKVLDDDGGFDERHERKVEEKMAEWKAAYYQVGFAFCMGGMLMPVFFLLTGQAGNII